jgi:dynein heavy chain 1
MDLVKVQGEYKVKLRRLERSLLDALNAVQGNILDDDSVITTLETLKREAAEIQQRVQVRFCLRESRPYE